MEKKNSRKKIELLAPARDLECGVEAINHGADAVYIGAPRFGARAAAVNSLEDIAALVKYAHLYHARVYVTLNTILKASELQEAEEMIKELYRIGADALIIQDMALLKLHLPPIPLHASTQTDNRTAQKVKFLEQAGIRRVVLARELSPEQIRNIRKESTVELEAFVHGALCVSYSGQCYISQACFGRSANRGECAQFCRLPFTLTDAEGKTIVSNKHLLSLKDLNRLEQLELLLDAGVTSLKIEGRLKDRSYVKNITAAYRQRLDDLFRKRKEYTRASSGRVALNFQPQPEKSFSRGFTPYLLDRRDREITSFDTPKSLGEPMGTFKERRKNFLVVSGTKPFHNGDGICYLDESGKLQGFKVNRVEENKLFPAEMPSIPPKTPLYRNYDHEFEKQLAGKSGERKIPVTLLLRDTPWGFSLQIADEEGNSAVIAYPLVKEEARSNQRDTMEKQLSRLGNTPFEATAIGIELEKNWFIPASALADMRREGCDKLLVTRKINYKRKYAALPTTTHRYPQQHLSYLGNVSNPLAAAFYKEHGVVEIEPAFEEAQKREAVLMFCKHCIRYSMGWCPRYHRQNSPYREPYYLVGPDNRRFRLDFDCKVCEMKVVKA